MLNSLKITTSLIKRKRPDFEFTVFRDTRVTPLSRPLNKRKLAIATTGGLHLKTDRPFDLSLKEGDCSYRVLPGNPSAGQVTNVCREALLKPDSVCSKKIHVM